MLYRGKNNIFANSTGSVEEEQRVRDQEALEGYKLKQPWENSSSYAVQEHEALLDALDYRGLHAPWDRNEVELVRPRTTELMSSSVRNNKQQPYKYIPLHQPVELTPAQIKKMKDHKTMAPFRTEDNYDPLSDPTLLRKCVTPQPRTLAPYLQGREAPPLNSSKRIVAATRNTALWNVSSGEDFKNKEKEESSGDPVLDKLKAQLKSFGASGILGLSRRFRIMVGFFSLILRFADLLLPNFDRMMMARELSI